MNPVQDEAGSPPAVSPLSRLDGGLRQALLPLAFDAIWHPTGSLNRAPDLPDGWFRRVTAALNLTVDDGQAHVPGDVQAELRQHLQLERPHLFRHLAQEAADDAFARDDLHTALALLQDGGLHRQAETGLVAWISRWDLADRYDVIQAGMSALPEGVLTPRVMGAWWHSMVRKGGEAGVVARRAAQAAYDSGEREPEVLYVLVLGYNFDGQHELALSLAGELLAGGGEGLIRLRTMHQRAMALLDLGRRTDHHAAAETLIEEATRQGRLDFLAAGHAALAYALEEDRQWEAAAWHFERAIATNERGGHHRQLVVLLNNYAQFLTHTGQPALARLKLQEARAHLSGHAGQLAWLALSEAILDHQYGEHAAALVSARTAVRAAQDAALDGYAFAGLLLETQRLTLDGQAQQAAERLREARALLPAGDTADAAALRFTAAVYAYLEGDKQEALAAFQELAREETLHVWDQVRAQLYLLDGTLQRGEEPEPENLERCLAEAGTDAPLRTDAARLTRALAWLARQPHWAERVHKAGQDTAGSVALRFELFAPLAFTYTGGPLHFPLKRAAELLAFLALHGPSTRPTLLMALFGATGDAAADHFKKVLRSLRQTLTPLLPAGSEAVMVEQGRYQLSPLLSVTCAWYPPTLFPSAQVRTGGPLVLTGPFMDGASGPWVEGVLHDVHEELVHELEDRVRQGVPDASGLLARAKSL